MFALRRFLNPINNKSILIYRSIYSLYETEYNVSPFVKLIVKCPFNVEINPLDVHKYLNCDKILIKLESDVDNVGAQLHCKQQKDVIKITGEANNNPIHVQSYGATYKLSILVPVKADINVETTLNGNISLKSSYGSETLLKTNQGTIQVSNLINKIININSDRGSIYCDGTMQASRIDLTTALGGCIECSKLQGETLKVKTQNGNITTKSSYCNQSSFETSLGSLKLENLHKNCLINIRKKGNLNITGLDGTLNAEVASGNVDIQISKLHESSNINVLDKGDITLRLCKDVQNHADIIFNSFSSKDITISNDVKLKLESVDENIKILKCSDPDEGNTNKLCIKSHQKGNRVCIENSSWGEMFKLTGVNFK